jgi:hypothetical protein
VSQRIARLTQSSVGVWLRKRGAIPGNLVLLALAAVFLYRNHETIFNGAELLREVSVGWLSVALVLQLLLVLVIAQTFFWLLHRMGHPIGRWRLTRLHLRRVVISTIVPIGTPVSYYVFLRALERRGVPVSDGLLAVSMRSTAALGSFTLLFLPIAVVTQPSLQVLLGAALASISFAIAVIAIRMLLRGRRLPEGVHRRLPAVVLAFFSRASAHHIRDRDLLTPLGWTLASNAVGVLTLQVALLAVGQPLMPGPVIVAYAVSSVLLAAAPLFQGAGVVEVGMAVTLEQLGVPADAAIAATLLFRLCDVWFPLLVGLLAETAAVRRWTRWAPKPEPLKLGQSTQLQHD